MTAENKRGLWAWHRKIHIKGNWKPTKNYTPLKSRAVPNKVPTRDAGITVATSLSPRAAYWARVGRFKLWIRFCPCMPLTRLNHLRKYSLYIFKYQVFGAVTTISNLCTQLGLGWLLGNQWRCCGVSCYYLAAKWSCQVGRVGQCLSEKRSSLHRL